MTSSSGWQRQHLQLGDDGQWANVHPSESRAVEECGTEYDLRVGVVICPRKVVGRQGEMKSVVLAGEQEDIRRNKWAVRQAV